MCVCVSVHMYATTANKKETMNLKERTEVYGMICMEGKRGGWCNYNLKNSKRLKKSFVVHSNCYKYVKHIRQFQMHKTGIK